MNRAWHCLIDSILLCMHIKLATCLLILILFFRPFKTILDSIFFTPGRSEAASALANCLSNFPSLFSLLDAPCANKIEHCQKYNDCDDYTNNWSWPTLLRYNSIFVVIFIIFNWKGGHGRRWFDFWWQVTLLKWYYYFDLMIILAVCAPTGEPSLKNFVLCEFVITHLILSTVPPWAPEAFPIDKAIEIGVPLNWCIYWKVLSKIVFDYVVVLITKTHAWLCNNKRSLILEVFNVPCDYILFVFYLFSSVKTLKEVSCCSSWPNSRIKVTHIIKPRIHIENTFEAIICFWRAWNYRWKLGINS